MSPSVLSNAQLEILRAFSHNLNEQDLIRLREVIDQFFAERAIQAADQAWDQLGWSDKTVETVLQTKNRRQETK